MIKLSRELVAPCGINCGVCKRYLATIKKVTEETGMPACAGCRPRNRKCAFIKGSCELLRENKINFCFECRNFPCEKLQRLNRRYTIKYNTNLVNNLREIKRIGLDEWLRKEQEIWRCMRCGGTISVHDRRCYDCGAISLESV